MSQKVIIPKDLINPDKTRIIDIPANVENIETVIPKPLYKPISSDELNQVKPDDQADFYRGFYDACTSDEVIKHHQQKHVKEDVEENVESNEDGSDLRQEYMSGFRFPNFKNNIFSTPTIKYVNPIYSNVTSYNPFACPKISLPGYKYIRKGEKCNINPLMPRSFFTKSKFLAGDVMSFLDVIDRTEIHKLINTLREYQVARRNLISSTTNLNSIENLTQTLHRLY